MVEIWIDRGGTFTDCILHDPKTGERRVVKVLSSNDAPLRGLRMLLDLSDGDPIPPCEIRMGTTVSTNALLERSGARTGLVITRGFRDLLSIGDQTRSDLFQLAIEKPAPLTSWVEELDARLDAQGKTVAWPTDEELALLAHRLASQSLGSIALVVINAHRAPERERALRDRLLRLWPTTHGAPPIIASTEAVNEMGLLGRTGTAVLDSYLTPLLRSYSNRLASELAGCRLRLIQSSGDLSGIERFRGPNSLLSGPAGGIVAGRAIAEALESKKVVTLDMGGTSTDVSLIEGEPTFRFESRVAGIDVRAKMMDIHTIAAGGGSECRFDGYGLTVGPSSVGADPGPICYGKQGTAIAEGRERLALTDVNLALGRICGDHFPFELDQEAAIAALNRLAEEVSRRTGTRATGQEVARGLHAVATTHMAEAIRSVAIQRGADLRGADLLVFGGAAGQHACDVASALGVRRIIVHRLSGVLSAFGIGQASTGWSGQKDAGRLILDEAATEVIERTMRELEAEGLAALARETATPSASVVTSLVSLRYRGADGTLLIPWKNCLETLADFANEHQKRFGFTRPGALVEIVSFRVDVATARQSSGVRFPSADDELPLPAPLRTTPVLVARGTKVDVPVFELSSLEGATGLEGPALLIDPTGTYLVDEGYTATLRGDLLAIEHRGGAISPGTIDVDELSDVASIQIMATRFSAVAEQMGEALRRSAASTNIRDRLDFSCALFDPEGNLVANAPHIPVHLGAMSESVKAVLARYPRMKEGEAYVTNDPALGGSHLPDITVVSPVFDDSELVAFTASRGHHADIGGRTPGSMPADSTHLDEEGVVLSAVPLLEGGRLREASLRQLLGAGPYPARNIEENLADLSAQLAANQLGGRLFRNLCRETSRDTVTKNMSLVRRLAARWMSDALARLPDAPMKFGDSLDDGSPICVTVEKVTGGVHVDFTGTSKELSSNLNAPRAVTIACVLYVLRTFLDKPLPLNQGCLDPVRITIPQGSLLSPSPGRAVAAGNVETSQRVVDVLLGALGLAAASQGTMNNVSFGTAEFGYYETLAGGAGAGDTFDGASAVHTHMTNTRVTDPELLEARFPVRLTEFSIRRGSGGTGRRRGGDGLCREIEALAPLDLSLITSRRTTVPFGLAGGNPGASGRNLVAGRPVDGTYSGRLQPGEHVRIETPGGGGYGAVSGAAEPADSSGA